MHWVLSALPLGLAAAAVVGAFWQSHRRLLRGWLLIAVVLLAGSVFHDYVLPSAYGGELLTTADALSLVFAVVVAVGGISELRRVASERATLLATERERAQRLNELNALRSDFSAMIAHELETPIAAVRKLNEMLSIEGEDPRVRTYATTATEGELDALTNLVRDVRAVAVVEREGFEIEARRLPLEKLLTDAEAYANTLPGGHSVKQIRQGDLRVGEWVLADPERIGQVLRNLLSNAAKYSPEGTPMELRVIGIQGRVRIEVADHGQGINPDDVLRIFEKFGRGRERENHKIPGVGLGLYFSERIVRSHGSELTVQTRLGVRVRAGGGAVSEEVRIVVVDDHDTFREPLAFMLERESDLTVVARLRSLSEAREVLESAELAVDVAIVDLNLPDGSGTDFISGLKGSRPQAMALVLSATAEQKHLAKAIEAGAAGVMHKSAPMNDLVEAVRRLAAGEQLLSQQEVIEALRYLVREREIHREAQLAIDKLTPREREVLQALGEGLSDKEIARRFHVGVGTVHSHVASILSKLQVSSRLQALVFAVRYGVVTIE